MASGNAVKWGIVVVGFAVAGYLYATSGPADSEPSIPVDAKSVDLCCTACGHHFTLGAQEMQQQVAKTPQPAPLSSEGARFRHSGRRPDVVPCIKCSENTAVLGTKCPEHGIYFPAKDIEGRRGSCPECG